MTERLDFVLQLVDKISGPARKAGKGLDGIGKALKGIGGSNALGKLAKGANAAGAALSKASVGADRMLQTAANLDLASNSMRRFSDASMGAFLVPVKEMAEFDRGMARVKALTSDFTEEQRKLARQMGSDTRYTAEQAAGGLGNLAMAGFSAQEQMQSLQHVLNLDTAGEMNNLSETATIAARTLRGFGLEASETKRVADVLTRTFTNSNTTLQGLGETFSYVAPVAKAAGVPLEDVAKAAGILGDASIDSSRAGTALRLLMANISGASPPAAKALAELGVKSQDAHKNMRALPDVMLDIGKAMSKMGTAKRIKVATKIFGMRGMSAGLQLADQISAAGSSFTKLENAMGPAGTTAAKVAEVMEDHLLGDVTKVESAVSDLKIEIGTQFRPELRALAGAIKEDIIPAMREWTGENEKATKAGFGFLGGLGVLTAGLAGLATIGAVGAAIAGGILKLWSGLVLVTKALRWVVTLGGNLGKVFQFLRMMTIGVTGLLGDALVAATAGAAGAFAVLGVAITGTALAVLTQWRTVREFFADWPQWFHELGANIAGGLVAGWRAVFGSWESEIVNSMTGITKTIESIMGINSPSKVMAGIGENMAAGLSQGFTGQGGGIATVAPAVPKMGAAMAQAGGGRGAVSQRNHIEIHVSGSDASADEIGQSVTSRLESWFDSAGAAMGA